MSGRIKAEDIVYVREHAHIDDVVTAAGVRSRAQVVGRRKGSVLSTMRNHLPFMSLLQRITITALVAALVVMSSIS